MTDADLKRIETSIRALIPPGHCFVFLLVPEGEIRDTTRMPLVANMEHDTVRQILLVAAAGIASGAYEFPKFVNPDLP